MFKFAPELAAEKRPNLNIPQILDIIPTLYEIGVSMSHHLRYLGITGSSMAGQHKNVSWLSHMGGGGGVGDTAVAFGVAP